MGEIKSYKELRVWQNGIEIADKVYSITKSFPSEERFGLVLQMRRCSVSIVSNIAEGWGRENTKNFINFLRISKGSLFELETQLLLSKRQNFISESSFVEISEILEYEDKMLKKLIISLQNSVPKHLQEEKVKYKTFSVLDSDDEQ